MYHQTSIQSNKKKKKKAKPPGRGKSFPGKPKKEILTRVHPHCQAQGLLTFQPRNIKSFSIEPKIKLYYSYPKFDNLQNSGQEVELCIYLLCQEVVFPGELKLQIYCCRYTKEMKSNGIST